MSDSTCVFVGTSNDVLTIIIRIVYQLYISQYMYSEIFFKLRLSLRLDLRPLVKLDPYACLKGDLMEMDNYIYM